MKVGNLVRNEVAVRTNPIVNESRGWEPIPAGHVGLVVGVRQTDLNAHHNANGKGDVYVDVELVANGEKVRCGNYLASMFEIVA
jgi:hypothetical protein